MLVNDTGVDIGEADVWIMKFGQVILMDPLLESGLEALCHQLEGVVHLLVCIVADEEFAPSLGRHIGGNIIRVLSRVLGMVERDCQSVGHRAFPAS